MSSGSSSSAPSLDAEADGDAPILNITSETKAPATIGEWKIQSAGQLGNSITYTKGSKYAYISYSPIMTLEDTKTPGNAAAFKHSGTPIPGGYCGSNNPRPEEGQPLEGCRLAATEGTVSVTVPDSSPEEVKEFARQTQEALK
ncbi:Uncharacterised protein [Rothia kristinae]|nr:Uncharacterised protein [Rothia kristinae]